ncbi:SRPBCC domain-containing protein [Brachybacterium sp. YJGR34]|uniref:SRPBCC family protein n=1 Tax=Brachybacterium sp. YJGR34 TaxID=2059911 RepID=UPI000E0AECC5|nr:SRPBCC domain-containing protein [Brachybacterium sp. YJGR34]
MSDGTLHLEIRPAAPPRAVHRALTDAQALRTWLAENAEVSPAAGRFAFWGGTTPQGDRAHQRLLAVEEDRLRFEWILDGTSTVVEIALEPGGEEGAVLHLRQDGLPTLEQLMAPTGRRDGLHSMHTFWGLALARLTEHVEGRPLTPGADFRPDRPLEIRARVEIAAPREAVFASLVDPEQIARWFGWEVELDARVGGSTTFGLEGTVDEVEPGRALAWSDAEGARIRWELEESGGGTVLTFLQTGYLEDERDSAAQHEAGWLAALAELARLHALGDDWTPLLTELPADH